ncbi:aldehyde dehydrogenase family protein [Nocardia fusca]|uniref:aldehyde dehydrogenase family protein n=1 Tax=Nocardia fusca TaxID=941183 RepID=UPI0037944178
MAEASPVAPEIFVGGRFVIPVSGRAYPNINPATGAQVGVAADAEPADMEAAIGAAHDALEQTSWARCPEARYRAINQLYDVLTRNRDEWRRLFVLEGGAPVQIARGGFFDAAIETLPYWAKMARDYEYEQSLPDQQFPHGVSRRTVVREPVGVVAAIVPWNSPFQLALAKIVPALAAGNSVVLKPAPDTPWSGLIIARAVAQTDIPPGIFNVVTSSANEIGDTLTGDVRVNMVTFTGSTAVGKHVAARGAQTVKRVTLELGGKSAFIALDDGDPQAVAAMAAAQISFHAGQGCALLTRLLLPRSRYKEGVEAVAEAMSKITFGDPFDPASQMGPLISQRQLDRVLGYIEAGKREGARLVLGGNRGPGPGFFVEPTLFADVRPESTIAQEEIFGPVLSVIPYDTEDDAVAIANGTKYGLSSGVMGSPDRAAAIARRLRAGSCSVNGGVWYGVDSPFGGYRESGVGRENGVQGFEEYLETKVVAETVVPA